MLKNVLRVLLKSNLERGILAGTICFDILKVEMVLCVFGIEISSGEYSCLHEAPAIERNLRSILRRAMVSLSL